MRHWLPLICPSTPLCYALRHLKKKVCVSILLDMNLSISLLGPILMFFVDLTYNRQEKMNMDVKEFQNKVTVVRANGRQQSWVRVFLAFVYSNWQNLINFLFNQITRLKLDLDLDKDTLGQLLMDQDCLWRSLCVRMLLAVPTMRYGYIILILNSNSVCVLGCSCLSLLPSHFHCRL